MSVKNVIKQFLPRRYDHPYSKEVGQRVLLTFGLQRSGQHLVIDWICRGLQEAIHLNNCYFQRHGFSYILTPGKRKIRIYSSTSQHGSVAYKLKDVGRHKIESKAPSSLPKTLLYSVEDKKILNKSFLKLIYSHPTTVLIILRDPANWLASTLHRGVSTKRQILDNIPIFCEYLDLSTSEKSPLSNIDFLTVNYNIFINDSDYRMQLFKLLGLYDRKSAEDSLKVIPEFGGGSSFKEEISSYNRHERWKYYVNDNFFQEILRNERLIHLSKCYFGELPGLDEWG